MSKNNLSKFENKALLNLSKNRDIVIKKGDNILKHFTVIILQTWQTNFPLKSTW